jgi:hypothetical protein
MWMEQCEGYPVFKKEEVLSFLSLRASTSSDSSPYPKDK